MSPNKNSYSKNLCIKWQMNDLNPKGRHDFNYVVTFNLCYDTKMTSFEAEKTCPDVRHSYFWQAGYIL